MNRRQAMAAMGATGTLIMPGEASSAQPEAEKLRVTVVIPAFYSVDGKLDSPPTLRNAGQGLKFYTIVENISKAEVFLWAETNSEGDNTLSFEFTLSDETKVEVKRIPQEYTKNIIRAERLEPGGFQIRAIEYDTAPGKSPQWDKFPFGAKEFKREVTLRAIFSQPVLPNNKQIKLPIWSGKVVSAPLKVILLNG